MSKALCARTSLEMVEGSLHKNLAMSLNDLPSSRERWMYLRSSSVRCFWFPGIKFDIYPPSTAVRRQNKDTTTGKCMKE